MVGASGRMAVAHVDSARVGAGGDRFDDLGDVRDREAFDHQCGRRFAIGVVVFAILLWRHVNPGVLVLVGGAVYLLLR